MEVSRQIRTSEEDETKGISLRHLVETRRTQQDGLGLLPAAHNHKLYDAAAVANIFLPGWRSKVLAPDHGCRTKEIKISERTVSGAPANLRALDDPKYGRRVGRWRAHFRGIGLLVGPEAEKMETAGTPGWGIAACTNSWRFWSRPGPIYRRLGQSQPQAARVGALVVWLLPSWWFLLRSRKAERWSRHWGRSVKGTRTVLNSTRTHSHTFAL
ncbi:hypothetical protein Trisim1_002436 [Trichoderma cf. simile WF8]